MTDIESVLSVEIGMLSGKLAAYIAKQDDITIEAARKRIERVKTPVHKVKGLFVDNQSFIYHSDHFASQEYFEKLNDAFEIAGKRCAAIINTIKYHHGIILKSDLANYSFSPVRNIKGHVTFDTLITKLKSINVIMDYDENHYELNSYLDDSTTQNIQHYKAIQFTQNLVINQFSKWSRNTGLVSFNTGLLNSEVGGFQFAFTSPSYINGFVQYQEGHPKPGFLVTDVVIGNSTKLQDVSFFINKIQAIKASNPSIRLFPVILIDGVEPDGLNQLKQAGVMIGTIRELFGEDYNELLKNLINTITNAGTVLKKDPESYIKLMEQLTKLVDGKTNNLRGDLFELAVGYYYGQHCKYLEVGKKVIPGLGEIKRDIDVFAVYENEVKAVECKGYNYPIDEKYIERYLTEIIPATRKWMLSTFPEKMHSFEIWSTGGFTPEAIFKLENAKQKTKKYSINYLDKKDILEKAKMLKTSKFYDILKDYYFKEIA